LDEDYDLIRLRTGFLTVFQWYDYEIFTLGKTWSEFDAYRCSSAFSEEFKKRYVYPLKDKYNTL
jgi:hypothetical protein